MFTDSPQPTGPTDSSCPIDQVPGYRTLKPLRSRGLPRELLAVREGPAEFRRLCSLRCAPANQHAGDALAREAAILARLHHPTILPAFDFLHVDGWNVLVLAFEGVFTLERITTALRKQPVHFDLSAAMFVAHDLFHALAHAHEKLDADGRPIVHGDMHPANIVLCRDGHVLIRGFRGPDRGEQESPGTYAAPELAQRQPASPLSDLYGAAALVWELLSGQALPDDGPPPSLAVSCPALPAHVAAVLDICLSPDPDARRVRASTVAASLRKGVDLQKGRESLRRLHARVLRRLPVTVRSICAGTLPPRTPSESSSPTHRFRRTEPSHPRSVLIIGHPSHPLHRVRHVLREDPLPSALGSSELREESPFDDEAPTLRGSSSSLSWEDPALDDGDDTLVKVRDPADTSESLAEASLRTQGAWGRIDPPPARVEPRSFPPVAADPSNSEPALPKDDGFSRKLGLALVLSLILSPGAWALGRFAAGPAMSAIASPTSSTARVLSRGRSAGVPLNTVDATGSASCAIAGDAPAAAPSAVELEIPFHQAMLIVDGPPEGIVYVNGNPVGRTGEPSLTRGCGLRFVRVGTEKAAHGVTWLSKGHTARLPCGTLVRLSVK